MTPLQWLYMYYWLKKIDREGTEFIERILGTFWKAEDFEGDDASPGPIESMRIPLVVALNPDILEHIKKKLSRSSVIGGGTYKAKEGEQIIEMDERMSKEEFLQMVGALGQARPQIKETPADQFIGYEKNKDK